MDGAIGLRALLSAAICFLAAAEPLPAQDKAPGTETVAALPAVTVAAARTEEVQAVVPVAGTMRPRNEVQIFARLGGLQIIQVVPEIGDHVARGDVLIKLRSDALEAELRQADADLARAEAARSQASNQISSADTALERQQAEMTRYESLRDSGSVSQAAYDQVLVATERAKAAALSARDQLAIAEAQRDQARAARSLAALRLDWAQIVSPVDGVVASKNAAVGSLTTLGGEPLLTVIENGMIEFEADVIETAIGEIKPGDYASLDVAGIGKLDGFVRLVPPSVDPVTRLGKVMITPELHAELRTGLFASGDIVTERRMGLTVPITSILSDGEGSFVLLVVDGVVERRAVRPGLVWQGRQEVVEGLKEGDQVIQRAGAFFRTGDRVQPIENGGARQ